MPSMHWIKNLKKKNKYKFYSWKTAPESNKDTPQDGIEIEKGYLGGIAFGKLDKLSTVRSGLV